jgi:hypothetical protein
LRRSHRLRRILEAGEEGQAVYRLVHQGFADYYRRRWADSTEANARISNEVAKGIKGEGWLDADGYLRRHLASHASAGRALDERVADPGYLAVADPIRLRPALTSLVDETARNIADIYRRIIYELPPAEPLERAALIHLVACQEAPELAPNLEFTLPSAWRCRWANWMASAPNRILGRHMDSVNAVALGQVAGEVMVVSGSADNSVRRWDARMGQPVGLRLLGHKKAVETLRGVSAHVLDELAVLTRFQGKLQTDRVLPPRETTPGPTR